MIPGQAQQFFEAAAAQSGAAAYEVERSLRFNPGDSGYLDRNFSSTGNRRTFTYSYWVKESGKGSSPSNNPHVLWSGPDVNTRGGIVHRGTGSDAGELYIFNQVSGTTNCSVWTNSLHRDFSAWKHIVWAIDTTQSTATDRVKLYINGVQETLNFVTTPAQNLELQINLNQEHRIGRGTPDDYGNFYLTEVHFIDGQALAASDFGEYDSNNVWQPKAYSGTYGTNGFRLDFSDNSSNAALGYDAAATQPELAPRSGMDVVTYTGNGSDQTITDLDFKPDLVWVKARNAASTPHLIVDSVRGGSKVIESHSTGAQVDYRNIGGCITAFLDNGFSTGSNADIATNGRTYVAWCWKAGGTAVSNTDGTITSSVSANTDYGFSVVNIPGYTYPTKTAGHGLGVAPAFIISKNTGTSNPWIIYHQSTGVNTYLQFDTGAGYTGVSGVWSGITSSVFPLNQNVNQQTDIVAYCWSEVSGFSKFGSYTGNGSATGPTVTTGFKLRYLLVKRTDSTGNWIIYDTARDNSNPIENRIVANSSNAEVTSAAAGFNFLADGFQPADSNVDINASGGTYIYAAFADRPGNNWDVNNIIAQGNDYANGFTGTERSGFEWVYVFNGNVNQGSVPNASTTWTWTPSSPISFTTLALYAYKDSSPGDLEINGTSVISQIPNHNGVGTNQRTVITGISSPLTSIKNISLGSLANVVVAGIEIDGTLLVSSPNANIDSLIDTPTDYEAASGNNGGNYATWNPLDKDNTVSYANGNLEATVNAGATNSTYGTVSISSGKWYWEVVISGGNGSSSMIGVAESNKGTARRWTGANGWYYYETGVLYNNTTSTSYGASYTNGDVIGVALDMDNGNLVFYKNGSSQGTAYSTGTFSGKEIMPAIGNGGGANVTYTVNFGQRPFAYTPPTGHVSLCTQNLADPTIADGSTAMDATTYTGAGGTQTISGINHSPDFVWIKSRSIADQHCLFDTVRGTLARLQSNSTNAEATINQYGSLTAFNSDGFTLTAGSSSSDQTHGSGNTYIGWTWDGGTSTVSNTDGSITSSVRANQSAGFSIVTYSGTGSNATFGHGLNAVPELVIVKSRSNSQNWAVQHAEEGPTKYAYLNSTNEFRSTSGTAFWNDTAPTTSVVSVGTDNDTNNGSQTYVAYCFAPVAGYSAFGKYTGNGSTDGPFVYTGFRPRWIMIKKSTVTGSWAIIDAARGPYNITTGGLFAESSNAEDTRGFLDILSNGFKITSTIGDVNQSGQTHIVAAFAEHPFKTARAR